MRQVQCPNPQPHDKHTNEGSPGSQMIIVECPGVPKISYQDEYGSIQHTPPVEPYRREQKVDFPKARFGVTQNQLREALENGLPKGGVEFPQAFYKEDKPQLLHGEWPENYETKEHDMPEPENKEAGYSQDEVKSAAEDANPNSPAAKDVEEKVTVDPKE